MQRRLATWFLRLRGLSWADVGLRRPPWLRFALAIPLGLVGLIVMGAVVRGLLAGAGLQGPDYAVFAPIRGNLGLYLFFLLAVHGVIGADGGGTGEQSELLATRRKIHLMMMAGALAMGMKLHSSMIEATALEATADALTGRLDALSKAWTE